jgi:hypothetical protein
MQNNSGFENPKLDFESRKKNECDFLHDLKELFCFQIEFFYKE